MYSGMCPTVAWWILTEVATEGNFWVQTRKSSLYKFIEFAEETTDYICRVQNAVYSGRNSQTFRQNELPPF